MHQKPILTKIGYFRQINVITYDELVTLLLTYAKMKNRLHELIYERSFHISSKTQFSTPTEGPKLYFCVLLTPSLVRRNVIAITNEPMQNISTVLPFIIIPTICKKRKLCLLSVHNELVTNWEKLHRWCSALFSVSNLIISGFQVGTHSPLKHDCNWKKWARYFVAS